MVQMILACLTLKFIVSLCKPKWTQFFGGETEKKCSSKTFTFISSIPCLHIIIPASIQHVYTPPACFRLEVCRIGRCRGQNSPSIYVVILDFQDLNHLAIFLRLHALTRSTMEHHTWHPKSCKLQSASRTLFHPPWFWSHDMHKCPKLIDIPEQHLSMQD